MPYDAITIDANVIIGAGFKFDSGLLAQLSQFKDGTTTFLVSEIVYREVRKHLSATVRKARDAATLAAQNAVKQGLIIGQAAADMERLTDNMPDSREVARARMRRFAAETGMNVISAANVNGHKLVEMYFNTQPPFEPTGAKKNEFPDAIALLSLEEWARENEIKILAVSGDKGWASFAENSEFIDVVDELALALELLQKHTNHVQKTVASFLSLIAEGNLQNQEEIIWEHLATSVAGLGAHGEAHSQYHFELDTIEPKLVSFEISQGDIDKLSIVRMGHDDVVIRVKVRVEVEADAEFSLSIWDGIDKEYIEMGSTSVASSIDHEIFVLITLHGDILGLNEDLIVIDTEADDTLETFEFGELEMDYGDNDCDPDDAASFGGKSDMDSY